MDRWDSSILASSSHLHQQNHSPDQNIIKISSAHTSSSNSSSSTTGASTVEHQPSTTITAGHSSGSCRNPYTVDNLHHRYSSTYTRKGIRVPHPSLIHDDHLHKPKPSAIDYLHPNTTARRRTSLLTLDRSTHDTSAHHRVSIAPRSHYRELTGKSTTTPPQNRHHHRFPYKV
ncbi:hypothetical protein L6452_35986 [Arctium lappa]|uniref:Uncharacterized protein n=1 Tax=Arctium lappa TaxID=4217 RepID=A0ACB8Y8P4_ARCLA|nr:hypothetical protein L6452_35986 [Arctium lappa]